MTDPARMTAVVETYIEAFASGSADAVAALFADDASVEDPIGSPVVHGVDAIRDFYRTSMSTGAKLTLEGPVRIAGDYAVFPFAVHLDWQGKKQRIDVIDTFRFAPDGRIVEMRAFWGPINMHGLG